MANPNPKKGPGRPKGSRNKITSDIRAAAQVHGEMAIKELARLVREASADQARGLGAIKELLDRGCGKSPQPHDGNGEGGPIRHTMAFTWKRPGECL